MGDYRIEIEATGGHGCQREIKDGGEVLGCGSDTCPDCAVARFLCELTKCQSSIRSAKLTHWPGQSSEVVDDFVIDTPAYARRVARKRTGSF